MSQITNDSRKSYHPDWDPPKTGDDLEVQCFLFLSFKSIFCSSAAWLLLFAFNFLSRVLFQFLAFATLVYVCRRLTHKTQRLFVCKVRSFKKTIRKMLFSFSKIQNYLVRKLVSVILYFCSSEIFLLYSKYFIDQACLVKKAE